VQVDPIQHTLKASGTERLKLKQDEVLSSFAFKFNLRHYTSASAVERASQGGKTVVTAADAEAAAAANTGKKPSKPFGRNPARWLTKVGRCRLNLWNPS